MVIAKMMGAMGNQMFQYALGHYIAKQCNTELQLDLSFVNDKSNKSDFVYNAYQLDVFKLNNKFFEGTERRLFHVNEEPAQELIPGYDIMFPKVHEKYDIYLNGFFQKIQYTEPIKKELLELFEIKSELSPSEKEMLDKIQGSNSVCVNFRRQFGSRPETIDNITNPGANYFHGIYGMDYFNEAIKIIEEKEQNLHLFVFADDMEYVKKEFESTHSFTIVDHSYKGDRFASYLKLMQSCKHFIIPNSTFAWWVAYLSDTQGIVVTPKNWFNDLNINTADLRPESWWKI